MPSATSEQPQIAPPLPEIPLVNPDALPLKMRDLGTYLVWRAEWQFRSDKWRLAKIPCDRMGNTSAMTAPGNHSSVESAVHAAASLRRRHGPIYGAGIAFHEGCGIICIDLDGDLATGTSERLQEVLGYEPTWSEVSISGRGAHLFFRGDFAGKKTVSWRGAPIEIFGTSGFIALTGHRITGTPDTLAAGAETLENIMAEVNQQPAQLALRETPKVQRILPGGDEADRLADALRFISADDRDTWIKVGMSIHAWNASAGLEIWDTWSSTSSKFKEGECAKKWAGFKPNGGVGIASLFKLALDSGWAQTSSPRSQVVSIDGFFPVAKGQPQESRSIATGANGQPQIVAPRFKLPVPISELVRPAPESWLLHGVLKRDGITLLSSLWKTGKTTLLSRLLVAFQRGGVFLGLPIRQCKVLYVSEENPGDWADRRDMLGITDDVSVLTLPFTTKPTLATWSEWLRFLGVWLTEHPHDILVLDTLPAFSPVTNENDAAECQSALMPLRALASGRAILMVSHLKKFDDGAGFGTGTRGSGALMAFVDVGLEMRRFGDDPSDRRRVLTSVSRYAETPAKLVIRLADDGSDFEVLDLPQMGPQRAPSQADRTASRAALREVELRFDEGVILGLINTLTSKLEIATLTKIRNGSKLSRVRADGALERLRIANSVEEFQAEIPTGQGARKGAVAFRVPLVQNPLLGGIDEPLPSGRPEGN